MVVSPLSPAGVVDRREIIYSISLAVARRFGVRPGTEQYWSTSTWSKLVANIRQRSDCIR
jgi:hypothetical protein